MLKKIINNDKTPILIPIIGFCSQVILWGLFFSFVVLSDSVSNRNAIRENIILIGSAIIFFLPLISLLGIYLSIRNMFKKVNSKINKLGLILNLTWFAFLLLASWLTFIVGINH